ncbi:histidine kinase [Caulobacter sp. Root487D2Y]|uniref:ATP-binding protein n=1 Tax=Caulobacter sp. Root487D2Y TaxID=1736547 RepID=UPI0007015A1D|nr:ATP-binding protein [Caulobacter sp. Root487D2Y]KQY30180.1 histidine kinase [Caulobacter sp. Root487D2Y]
MLNRLDILDERVDEVAAASRRTRPRRLIMAVFITGFLVFNLGLRIAFLWFAAALLADFYGVAVTRLAERRGAGPKVRRAGYVSAVMVMVGVWTSLAVVLWLSDHPALRFAAICLTAGQLIHAQAVTFRSPTVFALDAGVPALALAGMPLLLGGYSGWSILTVLIAVALVMLYVVSSAAVNARRVDALEAAERAAMSASAAKSMFLATMSHELRTPMNGVLGMAHALSAGPLNDQQARQVDMLIRSGEGLMTILNDVLDVSKIEAGKLELESLAFNTRGLVDEAASLWTQAAQAKDVRLVCVVDPLAPTWVIGDPTRLRQILTNLISNALKFTASGTVTVRVGPAGAAFLEIQVVDTGIGMSTEQQSRLFQTFSQADASITRRFGGTGLGLAICKQLTELMGGAITVRSAPGEGSAFTVALPLPAAAAPRTAPASPSNGITGLRVLVADDNRINQLVARTILEAAGALVEVADNGRHALERLAEQVFDAVLMDVHMPDMDGLEALRRVRAGAAGAGDIPVIALTADVMHGDEGDLLACGFDAVQPKPIRPADLVRAIAEACAA